MAEQDETGLLAMTTGIVANFVAHNRVSPDDLPGIVTSVHAALSALGQPVEEEPNLPQRLTPAAIRKLIRPDGIVSLIDGRSFKSMRRHLTMHGYTPESYRERYGLPSDFPMVAADYAAARSAMAKAIGLGTGGRPVVKAVSDK